MKNRIRTETSNGITTVSPSGRLDAASAPSFAEALDPLIRRGDRHFVIDLGELEYLSSMGLRELMSLWKRLEVLGGKVVLAGPRPEVRKVIEISGYDRLFSLYPDPAAARTELKLPPSDSPVRKKAVVVDALSTGRFFPELLNLRGLDVIHVISSRDFPPYLTETIPSLSCRKTIYFNGDIPRLIDELIPDNPILAIPGAETGVELADAIAEGLSLPGNGTGKSRARRDKFLMQEEVRRRGLPTLDYCCSGDLEELTEWFDRTENRPVVFKLSESSATDGLHFLEDRVELSRRFHQYIGKPNALGQVNQQVLLQTYARGVEFVFNTVSYHGHHYFTDCWEYRKAMVEGGGLIYDYALLMKYPSEEWRDVKNYVRGVLDALDVKIGPAHTEIMQTAQGPTLIETGTRVMGASFPPDLVSECIGWNQLELTLDSYLDPKSFLEKLREPYRVKKYIMCKVLISPISGRLKSLPGMDTIRHLPTFHSDHLHVEPGGELRRTIDLFSSPGTVMLVHEDPEMIEQDYRTIRDLEQDGLYQLGNRE